MVGYGEVVTLTGFFLEITDTAGSGACWSNARRDKLNGDLGSTISLLLRVDL